MTSKNTTSFKVLLEIMWAPFSKSFNYDWLQLLPVRWTLPVVRGTFINCCFSKDGLQSCTHDLFNICPPHWCCYIPAMIPYWSLSITIHGYTKWHDILFKDNYLHCALQSLLEKLFIKKKKNVFAKFNNSQNWYCLQEPRVYTCQWNANSLDKDF